jgi:hypothetical protein
VRLIQSVLAKWRLFWSGLSQGLLSRNQQIGLFGELWFLSRWLAPFVGMGRAVEMWRGPVGARNDFETPRLGIEVKATARIDGAHVIHGLEQLLEPAGGSLLLFSLAVREEASAENSLPSVVASTRQLIGEDHLAMSTFDSMLFSSGYDERFVAEYAKYQFRVRGENLYHVKDNFPRLTPSSFLAALPPGVGNIEYELRLDSAGSWLLASNPSDAAKQLKGLLA